MTTLTGTVVPVRSLADLLPRTAIMNLVLVVGFALLTAGAAQIVIPLGITPVPITGQTFGVLLSGAVLGARRGAASQALYVGLGALGLPFYAGGEGGWESATGSTAGYLVGFVVAAMFVGLLAERSHDRQALTAVPAFVTGTVIIYALGAGWLALALSLPLTAGVGEPSAIALGVAPFVVGDALKALLAGMLLPVVWRTIGSLPSEQTENRGGVRVGGVAPGVGAGGTESLPDEVGE